jgi:hypothetical protein
MYFWRPITNFLWRKQAYNEENFKPKQRFYYSKLTWYNKENCWTNKSFTCLPLRTDDHILELSSALETSVIDNWKINNPTFDFVNDVNQDFSLKYSNNKMGINDVINKLSINNTRANLLH